MGVYVRSASALSSLGGARVVPPVWNDYNAMIERVSAQYRDDIVWPLTKVLNNRRFASKEARLDAIRSALEHVFTRSEKLRIPHSTLGFALRAAELHAQNNKNFNAFNFFRWLETALPLHFVAYHAVRRMAFKALSK